MNKLLTLSLVLFFTLLFTISSVKGYTVFNGETQIVIDGVDSIEATNELSVFIYAQMDTGQFDRGLIGKYGAGVRSWLMTTNTVTNSTSLRFIISEDGGVTTHWKDYAISNVFSDGLWHCVGFTFNGTLILYVDGEITEPTVKSQDYSMSSIYSSGLPITIGCHYATYPTLSYNYTGKLDEPFIVPRVMSLNEIQEFSSRIDYVSNSNRNELFSHFYDELPTPEPTGTPDTTGMVYESDIIGIIIIFIVVVFVGLIYLWKK